MKKLGLAVAAALASSVSFASDEGTLSRYKYSIAPEDQYSRFPIGDPACGIDHWEPGREDWIKSHTKPGAAFFAPSWTPVVDHIVPIPKNCDKLTRFSRFPTSPVAAFMSSAARSPTGWDANLPTDHKDKDLLIFYIMASVRNYAIIDRELLSIENEDIHQSGTCQDYIDRAAPLSFTYYRDESFDTYYEYLTGPPAKIDSRIRDCTNAHLHRLYDNFDTSSVAQHANSLYSALNSNLSNQANNAKIRKLLLLLLTLRTDVTLELIYNVLTEGSTDSFSPSVYFGGSDPTAPVNQKVVELFNSDGTDSVAVDSEVENLLFVGDSLICIPTAAKARPSLEAQKADLPGEERLFKTVTVVADEVSFSDIWRNTPYVKYFMGHGATSTDQGRRNGTNTVIFANKIIIGPADEPYNLDSLTNLITFPDFYYFAASGKPVFGSTDIDYGSSGNLMLISPDIHLSEPRITELRRIVYRFAPIIAPAGLDKISITADEGKLYTAGMRGNNEFASQIKERSKEQLNLAEFIGLWEKALDWEVRNNGDTVLHRYIYIDGKESYRKQYDVRRHYSWVPRGSTPHGIMVGYTPSTSYVQPNAIGIWLIGLLQTLEARLNEARVKGDHQDLIDIYRRIDSLVGSARFVDSGQRDDVNNRVARLLAKRQQDADLTAVRKLPIAIPGEVAQTILAITQVDSLRTKVFPNIALIEPIKFGKDNFIGVLSLVTRDAVSLLELEVNVQLVDDIRELSFARSQLEEGGDTLDAGPVPIRIKDGDIVVQDTVGAKVRDLGNNKVEVKLVLDPRRASVFLARFFSQSGIPIDLDWTMPGVAGITSNVWGPVSIVLTGSRRVSQDLRVKGSSIENSSSEDQVVQYLLTKAEGFSAAEPQVLVKAGGTRELSASLLLKDGLLPSTAIWFPAPAPSEWLRRFYVTGQGMTQEIRITNSFSDDLNHGGRHRNVELYVNCYLGSGQTSGIEYGPLTLQAGNLTQLNCLKDAEGNWKVRVSGIAFFENGGRERFDSGQLGIPSVFLNSAMFLSKAK
jgi:hypothetical protein